MTVHQVLAAVFVFIFLVEEYIDIDINQFNDITLTHSVTEGGVLIKFTQDKKTQNIKLIRKELVPVYNWLVQIWKEQSHLIRDLEIAMNVQDFIRKLYFACMIEKYRS